MDATCAICDKTWDTLDPGVRFIYGDGRWECWDEAACFKRRSLQRDLDVSDLWWMQRGLDAAWAAVDRAAALLGESIDAWRSKQGTPEGNLL